jgi:zinc/manganese transport system substrate-binding protein
MFTRRTSFTLIALALLAPLSPAFAQAEKLPVVATFSILGDLAKQVAGDRADVKILVGPGGDAHVFAPTPADARTLGAAKLVVVNGLKFEGWIDRLIASSKTKGKIVVAAKGVKTLRTGRNDSHSDRHNQGHAHAHGEADPHAWQDIANVKIYVANIRDGLIGADPDGRAAYEANAKAYMERLDALEAEIKTSVASIPPERRKIITTHDAFGYFAAAYGLKFIAPQGVSTDSAASAQDVARIIRQIRAEKIPAVFNENITDPRMAARIAQETGAKLGGTLYSDQLSAPDGPAGTYIDMVRHNIRELTKALADQAAP